MDIILSILAVVLLLVGIVGCVLPIIPGQVLAYCGLLCCYFCSYSEITTSYLWLFLALTAIVTVADFVLPALSVQPLVENAIKHGLMRLESGGTVVIRSYETDTHFCVEVKDDGVGFDTSLPIEEKKHVGLRNIRGRLKAMVNGELTIESQIGAGTKAVIMIPKEVTE